MEQIRKILLDELSKSENNFDVNEIRTIDREYIEILAENYQYTKFKDL